MAGLVQGDIVKFAVRFVQGGVAVVLAAPVFTASGIKAQNDFTGGYLIQLSAPVLSDTTLYTFTVSPLNSAQLNTFLQTYRNTWCALEIYDSANGILTTPLELQITPGYSLSGTPTDNAPGTLNVAAGKTATISNSITLTGTDGTSYNLATMGVNDGNKGDITVTASGATWTINNDTINLAKLAHMTTNRVIGRTSVGNGAPELLTISGTGSVAMTGDPVFTNLITVPYMDCTAEIQFGASATGLSYIDDSSANTITVTVPAGAFGTDKTITLPNATGTVALNETISGGTLAGSFLTLAGTSSATLGTNGGTGGSVVLRGSTSGSATINTSNTGVLALPSGTTATSMALTTPALGVATATSVQVGNGTSSVTSLQIGNNALNGFYSPSLVGTDIGVSANGTWVAFWNSSWGLVARLPIIPLSNNGTSCGTSGLRWSGVYSVLGDFSGAVVCGTTLAVTGATTLTGLLTANGGITVVGGAKLLTTNTALTNYMGANTATLDNSPSTGDPTKWIAINDDGTTRYIPTWS